VWRQLKEESSLLSFWKHSLVVVFPFPVSNYQTNMQKSARTCYYLPEEDLLVCRAYMAATTGPITGRDQKEADLARKMLKFCNENRNHDATSERSGQSLLARFRVISSACQKYNGIFVAVEARQPTGTTHEDRVRMAIEEMQAEQGKHFKYLQCWKYLSNFHKYFAPPPR
jgi:hypothetical protein